MELIRNFKQLNKNNADLAGGKGASLGEMTQVGIPVPPGFVILSESFEQFIKETDLVPEIDAILHKVNHKEIHTVESASEQIRELILSAVMPTDIANAINKSFKELNAKYVAVRSSATAEDGKDHAWAGQLESYLNITEDHLLTKVKLCWSSLFTPRAIFYRFEKGLHSTKISVAVVVQKMVESEVSGIAFSVHPVTEDYNQLIIEAGFGLGEAIVSGSVTPDSYVVEKEPRNILDINVSTQERALYRSENAFVEHGNNEWVAIPEPKASSQVLTEPQILELSEIILKIEKHYGFPCDIEWAYEGGKFYIVQSRPITTLQKNTEPQIEKHFIKWVTRPGSVTRDEPLLSWQVKEGAHMTFSVPTGDGNLEYYLDQEEYSRSIQKYAELISNNTLDHLSKYDKARNRMVDAAKNVKRLVNGETKDLLVAYEEYFKSAQNFCIYLMVPYALKDVIEPWLAKELGTDFEKVTALGKPTAFHHFQKALLEIAPEDLEKEYGWINVYSIKHKPYTLEQVTEIKRKVDMSEVLRARKEIEENEERFTKFYETIKDEKLRNLTLLSHEYAFLRTDRVDAWKEAMSALTPLIEYLTKVIGNDCTLEDAGEMFYFEIVELLKNGTKPNVAELKARSAHKGIFKYIPENKGLFVQDPIEKEKLLSLIHSEKHGDELRGVVACKGKATGPVRIILNDADFSKFKKGDVLVATWTEPKYTSVMKLASAIVTDEGGLTSHAAIVSRELNIPCVIGTKSGTKILKDGDMVEVDADNGVIKIIK